MCPCPVLSCVAQRHSTVLPVYKLLTGSGGGGDRPNDGRYSQEAVEAPVGTTKTQRDRQHAHVHPPKRLIWADCTLLQKAVSDQKLPLVNGSRLPKSDARLLADLKPSHYQKEAESMSGILRNHQPRISQGNLKMLHNIIVNSPEYACFHEAGHAETALRVGARVSEMELYIEQPRSYGRTRVEKKQDRYIEQSRRIALGGFAAEYILYRAGRIVNEDGTSMSESQFIQYAYGNAAQDFAAFWATFNLPHLNKTQKELDEQFMSFAIGMAQQDMNAVTVERIADALLGAQKLTETEVTEAATAAC